MRVLFISAIIVWGILHHAANAAGGGTHITAPEALTLIKSGNARFVSGQSIHPRLTPERMLETMQLGQKPYATVLANSDSRVPVEAIMDQGVGDYEWKTKTMRRLFPVFVEVPFFFLK